MHVSIEDQFDKEALTKLAETTLELRHAQMDKISDEHGEQVARLVSALVNARFFMQGVMMLGKANQVSDDYSTELKELLARYLATQLADLSSALDVTDEERGLSTQLAETTSEIMEVAVGEVLSPSVRH